MHQLSALNCKIHAVIFLLILSSTSFATGPVHGAKGVAMGTAFSAVADDPSTIASNPAGLTQVDGTTIYGGATLVIPSTTFTDTAGQEAETDFQIFYPPHLYISSDAAGKDLRIGLGIYSPFGIGGRKWDSNGVTRYLSVKSQIATMDINPTIAYRVLPSLSVGFGINLMYSKNEAEKKVNQSMLSAPDGDASLTMDGWGWGFNAGILYTPHEKLNLGLAYRSKIKVRHSGHMDLNNIAPALQPLFGGPHFRSDVSSTITFPDIITIGAAYKPSKDVTVSLEAERLQWSSFRSADLDVKHEVPQAGFTDTSNKLNWKDIWTLKAGIEYRATETLALRCGYAYVQSPVPEGTLDPGNPDSSQHNASLGFGYKNGKTVIDFFYMAGFFTNREVNNTILSGSYDNFIHYTGISVGYRF